MLHRLGRSADTDDLQGLLLACHRRIRAFSTLAVTLATRADVPTRQRQETCERLIRYFSEALPQHARDEEESVAPRLCGRAPALDEALRQMADEHRAHHTALDALMRGWAALRERPDDDALRRSLVDPSIELRDAFETHLRDEETRILPHLAALSKEERDEAVRELRGRRVVAASW
jgi:hemerythrin superfamily protein